MARSTSSKTTDQATSTPRRSRRTKAADETPVTEVAVENTETTPGEDTSEVTTPEESTTQSDTTTTEAVQADDNGQEASVSTETVETVADTEATDSDTTETATEATTTEAPADNSDDITAFQAVVATALAEKDGSTGTLPEVQIEAVKASYRELTGAKAKNAAKKHLNEELRNAVNNADIFGGQAVMTLVDAIQNAGATPRATAERKPADPAAAYVERLAVLHLGYTLARADVPEGVETDGDEGAFAKVDAKVAELNDQAEQYYAWVNSKDENKGDEPEVDAIVKRAVKAAQGKAATGRTASATPRAASDGVRRNVRTHVAQVFADLEVGTFLKVAEIANKATEEYPDASCSPGAISAALKSDKGIEGFELDHNDKGTAGARKIA